MSHLVKQIDIDSKENICEWLEPDQYKEISRREIAAVHERERLRIVVMTTCRFTMAISIDTLQRANI